MNIGGKTVGFNSILQIGGKVVGTIGQLALFSLLTRYLGKEGYGQYAFILNLVGMTGLLADLGTSTIAIRELSSGRRSAEELIPQILLLKIGLALFASLVLALSLCLLHYPLSVKFLALIASTSLLFQAVAYNSLGLLFLARLESYRSIFSDFAGLIGYGSVVCLGVFLHRGLAWMVWATVFQAALQSAVVWFFGARQITWKFRWDTTYCWWFLREAFPLSIAGLFAVLYFKIDTIMLQEMTHDYGVVGLYNGGFKFIENSGFINSAFLASIFPILARSFENDRAHFQEVYQRCLNFLMVASFCFGVFLFVFSQPLVLLLCGTLFLPSADVLRICALAVTLMFINNLGAHLLFASGRQGLFAWFNLGGALLKIGLNLLVIPLYSFRGAAVATLACEIFICACVFTTIYRVYGWLPSFGRFASLLFFATLASLACLSLPDQTAWLPLLGISLVFGVALWLSSLLRMDDFLFIARQRAHG